MRFLPTLLFSALALSSNIVNAQSHDTASANERPGPAHVAVPFVPARGGLLDERATLVTHPGAGAGGTDESRLQNTSLNMGIVGAGGNGTDARLADDFVIPVGGYTITSITVYGYQTGSTTTSTFNNMTFRIWDGDPSLPASTIVFGDTTTNRFSSGAFSNIYRVLETTSGNTQRPVMAITASGLNIPLTAGTYWLDYSALGTQSANAFFPAKTTLGQTSTGNAVRFLTASSAWAPIVDVGPQGLPLTIDGIPPVAAAPTLTYTPDMAAGVTFPGGPAGVANATIGITSAGAVGVGQTAVTGCAITGPGQASFGAVSSTPANGIFNTATTTGSIDLSCTRGLTVANASLTCTETATPTVVGSPFTRVWALTCPAITPVAPVAAVAATTLAAGTGSVTPTITTPAQGSGSTQFACSIPLTAPSNFTITSNASQTITTTTAAIGLTCVPQAAITTATLTCTQTATPGPNPANATALITCPAAPAAAPTLTYNPTTVAGVTFPSGPAGTANASIGITSAGAVGVGQTAVTGCAITGPGQASFGAVTTTPANGIFDTATTTGSIDLSCTRGLTVANASLACTETATPTVAGSPFTRTWALTCPAVPQADLSITKTDGQTSSIPGTAVTYTIVASNAGPDTATATVGDVFPAKLTGSKTWTCVGAGGGTCTAAGTGNINDPVTLPSGASVTYTATATIAASATGTLVNTATVTIGGSVVDPNAANNSATDSNTLTPQADVSITISDAPDPATAGNQLTYTVTVANAGPSDAAAVAVAMTAPTGTTLVSAPGPIGTLAAGASLQNTFVFAVSPAVLTGTVISGTATVTSSTTDVVPGNNSATTTTTVNTLADLRLISLVPSVTQTNVNTPVTFTATSQNFGPSDAQNVVVSIVLSPDFRFTSLTATGATCTTPQVGNSGTITCTFTGATAPQATRVLAVTAFSNNQAQNSVSASTSSSTPDPVANNNAGAATVTVGLVIQGIPTLNSLSMLMLGLLLAMGGLVAVRRHS